MERRKKAAVWRYYDEDTKKRTVKCRLCDSVLKHHGNTTNLLKHIKAKHADESDLTQLTGAYGDPTFQPSPSKQMKKLEEATEKLATNAEEKKLLKQFMTMVAVDLEPDSSQYHHHHHHQNASDSASSLLLTKGKKSLIWRFFEAKSGSKEAKCALCSGVFRHHGNTTNLMKHLRAKHAAEARSINIGPSTVKQEPRSIASTSADVVTASGFLSPPKHGSGRGDQVVRLSNTTKNKLLDQKVMSMIIMDLQPVSSVDSKYFADVMKLADPRYTVPTKKTITSDLLPKLYKETVDQILTRLEDIKHIAITTELWSPRHQESYLGVTAHFICPVKWTLQSFMLSTTTFYGIPTGKHISSELERTLAEWDIAEKVRVMVTDNETNSLLSNEHLPWAYIPCLAHLIHIVVTDALSIDAETTALIEKISGVVRYFKGDEESKRKLLEAQVSLNLPENKLILSVPSRWNSIYFMLERALEQMDAINAVLEDYEKDEMCLTSRDGDLLKMVIAALKPFEIATKTMSSENSSTIGTAMPLVKGLKVMSSAAGGREPLATALKDGLVDTFGQIEEIDWIVAATVLDPRFKKFPYIEKDVIDKATEIIASELSSICPPEMVSETETEESSSKANADSLWVYLDFNVSGNSAQVLKQETTPASIRELQRYLESPPVSRDEDPLLYWKQHQELFPNLCQVALKYLTVPITSIPCRRLFTKFGESLMEKRSKLKAKNINMMLFLNNNLPHISRS